MSITLQQALTSASVDQGLKAQRVIWVISILSSSVFLRLLQISPPLTTRGLYGGVYPIKNKIKTIYKGQSVWGTRRGRRKRKGKERHFVSSL